MTWRRIGRSTTSSNTRPSTDLTSRSCATRFRVSPFRGRPPRDAAKDRGGVASVGEALERFRERPWPLADSGAVVRAWPAGTAAVVALDRPHREHRHTLALGE